VDTKEARIMGVEKRVAAHARRRLKPKTAGFAVPSSVPKWRARHDSPV
jgi:hypothetical protein